LEIVHGLGDEGILIYNGDEPLLQEELEKLHQAKSLELKTFGLGDNHTWSADHIELDPFSCKFDVRYLGEASSVGQQQIAVAGRHNVSNALAAIAVARLFGVPATSIKEGFAAMQLTGMR